MNEIIKYYLKSIISSSYSLQKKSILINKPWALVDNNNEIQKLIFNKNHSLILSKNGVVTDGSWDYYPEARALLIDRGKDKLLLKEQYIDDNVLILKKDGTDNDFFSLANENTIPDYDVFKYLNKIKCIRFQIKEIKLLNGMRLQIFDGERAQLLAHYIGKQVELRDESYKIHELFEEKFLSEDRQYYIYVSGGKIIDVKKNVIKELKDGGSIEIEGGNSYTPKINKFKQVTINGSSVSQNRIIDKDDNIYEINESRIVNILFLKEYILSNGNHIKIEQKDHHKITKGDKIVSVLPQSKIIDGSYNIKGKLFKIKIKDHTVL